MSNEGDSSLSRIVLNLVVAMMAVGLFVTVNSGSAQAEGALASWYGPGFEGNPTASGEPYNPYGYTAAHKTMPLGTQLTVNYQGNSVDVTVNDRGPYVGDRSLDLSQGAAEAIGLDQAGVDYVEYSYSEPNAVPAEASVAEPVAAEPVVAEPAVAEPLAAETVVEPAYDSQSGYVDESSYVEDTGFDGGTYIVQGGDTLTDVAAQLGTTVDGLAAANGLLDPDYIQAGQTLVF
jgi:rare lipoprotein A